MAEPTTESPAPVRTELPPDRFLNRELSWLDFNARVLELAEDDALPLLERVKFLAVFASNLDEFFMVRIAGLKRRQSTGLTVRSPDGLTIREQLTRVTERTQELVHRHALCFASDVRPLLEEAGIRIVHWDDLADADALRLRDYFRDQVFPVLTPLAVDPAHPFPYISGLSLNLAVSVRDPDTGAPRFARLKVPNNVPRFVQVSAAAAPDAATRTTFLPLEDLIAAHLPQLFPGLDVLDHHLFRVTRNADLEVEEDRDEDLLQALERELARRRFGPAVRLEVHDSMDPRILDVLVSELEVSRADVVTVPGLLDLAALTALYDLDRPELKDEPFVPTTHPRLSEGESPTSVFATLREGDVLVHHPYHSFATSVQRFIEQAAADPHVLAIKQTLYRTSGDSPIVTALIEAAQAGKQVVVLVEIKARFDEEANISWARELERAGCHVVYGLVGLKTHCKTALVVRREGEVIRRYCHIGTGNYNPKTARTYEDLGILTADPRVGADLTDLFNTLTGYSRQTTYRQLMVAPHGVRTGLVDRIRREVRHATAGRPAGIRFKVNSLVDEKVIDALYEASCAGVAVELLIRGICALRPGVPGLSENIRVHSIVGRFLEHSRVFHFRNAGEGEWWIGSADLMHRNLDRRVEVLLRVGAEDAQRQLAAMFDSAMAADVGCWHLEPDGRWIRRPGRDHQAGLVAAVGEQGGLTAVAGSGGAVDGAGDRLIAAAGGAVWRPTAGGGIETAVVHRPRYDDWSLPKGKVDAGEALVETAVREVGEETGLAVVVGRRSLRTQYAVEGGTKRVDYWLMEAVGGRFTPGEETDELRWLPLEDAAALVTHEHDRAVLADLARTDVPRSPTLLLVRHARAGDRSEWDGHDDLRPLDGKGRRQARRLAEVLPLFAPTAVLSAERTRCRETVEPLAQALGLPVQPLREVGEEEFSADPQAGLAAIERFLESRPAPGVTVVCSQGGAIPSLLLALGVRWAGLAGPLWPPSAKGSTWALGGRPGALLADYYRDFFPGSDA